MLQQIVFIEHEYDIEQANIIREAQRSLKSWQL